MLTKDTIKANEVLATLSEEQVSAIETLSRNDEDAVIGQRFGEVYRQLDSTIKEATGIDRIGDEKTYVYLKRATTAFADKFKDYDTLKQRVTTLQGEKSALEAEIAKGGDAALKSQLASVKAELTSTKDEFVRLKADYDSEKANHEKAIFDYRVDSELASARDGVKFKTGLNEAALNTLIAQAIANVKAKNPKFEVREGRERLIFHDANNVPLNNVQNKMEPFTAKELLTKEFEAMDILDKAPAKGAGGSESHPKATDILGATTQAQATEIINKMLFDRGLARGSSEYQKEYNKIWEENNIANLPLK